MAHELGHYVMNHAPKMLMQFSVLILFAFLFCQWAMQRLFARFGARWGTQAAGDVASLPLLAAVFSVFMMGATPVFNTIIRTQEIEADRFGLNLARDPHGFAEAMLKLADYRKPDPGALEEVRVLPPPERAAPHPRRDALAGGDGDALSYASFVERSNQVQPVQRPHAAFGGGVQAQGGGGMTAQPAGYSKPFPKKPSRTGCTGPA